VNREPPISEPDVRAALSQLHNQADTTGRPPTVLALARRLGLPNTTLRRRFPDICAELATTRTRTAATARDSGTAYDKLKQDNARLRRSNQQLTEHLDLAIANIQRLTITNHHLRQALETARNVTPMPPRPARPNPAR
jgi:hypothetical protein